MPLVGVVSDTHLPRFGRSLPRALLDGLGSARVDLILHAGDITAAFVLDELGAIAPVEAVAGNNDPDDLVARLGTARVIDIGGRRIGLTHGHLGRGRSTPERARSAFIGEEVDVVVFGHSHQPLWVPAATDGVVQAVRPALLNPGSPTDRRRERSFSYALLVVDRAPTAATIERFSDRAPG